MGNISFQVIKPNPTQYFTAVRSTRKLALNHNTTVRASFRTKLNISDFSTSRFYDLKRPWKQNWGKSNQNLHKSWKHKFYSCDIDLSWILLWFPRIINPINYSSISSQLDYVPKYQLTSHRQRLQFLMYSKCQYN